MNNYFAICPRGLEELLLEELRGVGAADLRSTHGGVHFAGDWSVCYRANLESRLATRILWHIVTGPYAKEDDIYRLAVRQLWPNHFAVSRTMRVVTTAIKCPLKSLDFVTLRVKDAVCDRFREDLGERPNIETRNPDVSIHVFLTENTCTLYLDTSGQPLWQRGFRKASVDAPLKENLAAGILKLSGWQPGMPLIDPMCGSGTFLLEAVQMALDRAPGLDRGFAFELLKKFEALTWAGIRAAAEARVKPAERMDIRGWDLDERAVRATRRNLQEAGFGNVVTVDQGDILEIAPLNESGVLVTNPPYGERIGEQDELAAFYPQLGTALKRNWAGWNCFFFTADLRLPKLVGLKPSRKTPLFNGPLECRLFEIRMVAGSNRKG
ncbi:putative N6-adenine-specific DNA methylase [Azonexus fungiphilus]|uniref:Putative N6-adenine-specific DNA methylase n=1 Tax=Azonexus fungiphilus TaxID=146940 RepID=A0A495WD69_9RHOO|nr:THUMP domain-containing protein [Azonexus fungiphilus]NHC06413.1 class I SAM-dependent RNA methyltransferase [Azonexus fungiphilus]RKT58703.1 putative N6-adenine-specific DNA methylase [Azonexus fungiphilus]